MLRFFLTAFLAVSFHAPAGAQNSLGSAYVGGAPASALNGPPGFAGAYLAARAAAARGNVDAAGAYFARALARLPNDPALLEQTLIYQSASGRVLAAIPIARKLLEFEPRHRMSNLVMTVDDIAAGRYEDAVARVEAAPEAYHPLVGALLKAWSEHGLGRTPEMAGLDERPIFRIFAGYHRGLMLTAAGDLNGSAAAFEGALKELNTPTGRMALAYGETLRLLDQPEKAEEIYNAAIGVSVGDATLEAALASLAAGEAPELRIDTPRKGAAEALFGLASALGQDEDSSRLSLFYLRLAQYLRPDFSDAAILAGEIFSDGKQYELAVKAYADVPEDSPLRRSGEIGRAEALYRLDNVDEATEALIALTSAEPDAIDAHLALGDLYRRTEEFDKGALAYDAAIKLMSAKGRENWVLYYERGICYERSDQWDLAEADFFKALELRPDQPLVLNYLGYSWLDKGIKTEEALPLIQKAVDQRPEDGYIVDSLGWAFYLLGDFDAAVRELERAVELRPIDPVITDHYGDALWRVGRRLEAEFQWKRALSYEPEERELTRIKRKLKVGLDVVLEEEASAEDVVEADDG
ncbi:MAG: tetratricopeptide repeat protein [Pseudomonadota bacterium]